MIGNYIRYALFLIILSSSLGQDMNRTVVFIYRQTIPGEYMFIRGGISTGNRPGCSDEADSDVCAIDIYVRLLGTLDVYDSYNSWRIGDDHLDWHGAEEGQASFEGQSALGTPLEYTSNDPYNTNYQELNIYGEGYWMVDFDMNCAEAEEGWFEFKSYHSTDLWEVDIDQDAYCTGDVGGQSVLDGTNHMGRCGYVNVFVAGENSCIVDQFP